MTLAKEKTATAVTVDHPLEPLTPDEITAAVAVVRQGKALTSSFRFATVTLNEPAKETVLSFKPGDPIEREAFLILLDNTTAKTYEAVVSLGSGQVKSWEQNPGVQPPLM